MWYSQLGRLLYSEKGLVQCVDNHIFSRGHKFHNAEKSGEEVFHYLTDQRVAGLDLSRLCLPALAAAAATAAGAKAFLRAYRMLQDFAPACAEDTRKPQRWRSPLNRLCCCLGQ